jgi:hypothetical protein
LSEEFKLSAAIEDFGVGQNEIAPDSIELWGIEWMELNWKCERVFERLN